MLQKAITVPPKLLAETFGSASSAARYQKESAKAIEFRGT
jgi:hypothetical protein